MAVSGTEASLVIDALRLLVALVALGVASLTDLRTRKVPNSVWYVAGGIGVVLLATDMAALEDGGPWALALTFPVAAFFIVVVTGGELWPVLPPDEPDPERELSKEEARVYVADLAVSAVLIAVAVVILFLAAGRLDDPEPLWQVAGSVLLILLALGFYIARLLHGGGDAKALMTLAVLFPALPFPDTLPVMGINEQMSLVFPFALSVLVNAALITVFLPLVFMAICAVRGPFKLPEALFGYPVEPGALDPDRMWLLYELEAQDAEIKRVLWPRRSEAAKEARAQALERMHSRGDQAVYMSPKLPFMVPMFIALLLTVIVGNIIFWVILSMAGL
jgi:Flp pilus assembly protein protease CpaA